MSTSECSCRLWPTPGMYVVTSIPLVSRTRATLRSAEFGFFGVVVYTRVQTPRRWGAATFFLRPLPDFRPGVASFFVFGWRPLRISCEVVGMRPGRVAPLIGRSACVSGDSPDAAGAGSQQDRRHAPTPPDLPHDRSLPVHRGVRRQERLARERPAVGDR